MTDVNPYNANKPWNSNEELERGFVSADDSLFFNNESPDEEDEEEEVVDEVSTNEEEDLKKTRQKTYKQPNYKKRYDDLKRHHDRKIDEFKAEKERILAEARAGRPAYTPPKTPEELATFKEEHADVYDIVETVAHMRSQELVDEMKQEIERLKVRDRETSHEKAKTRLLQLHPDFSEITSTNEFHDWAKKQPSQIQDWVYRNGTNADLAARAMDLYKKDAGISKQDESRGKQTAKNEKKTQRASAAEAVSISSKAEPIDTNGKIWTTSEIARLSLPEYEKYREEIDKAFFEGRVSKG